MSSRPTAPATPARTGLLRSGFVTASMTFVSRVFGLVRDNVIGQVFGPGAAVDAFLVAFRIPNLFRRLFAEGAFAQAFVRVFTEYRERRRQAVLRDLARNVVGTLGAVLLLVSTLGAALAPWLVALFAPGFLDEERRYSLAGEMLRITFPYLMLISLVACAGGMLNAHRRFAVPAFTPVLLNLSLIAAAWWLAPRLDEPVLALAWGVLLAGVVQVGFQLPFLARLGLLSLPRWDWHHPGVARIRVNMLPVLFASSVAQLNLLLDTVIASFLAAGSVSWLYFADRMVEFPLGVFGIALATVVLPHLSAEHAGRRAAQFDATLDWALRLIAYIGLAAALGLAALALPIVATIFEYGAFGAGDTRMAGLSLVAYASGLPAYIAAKVLAGAYYARQDTRTPVRYALISLASNAVLNLVLVTGLIAAGMGAPHVGLAAATSAAAWLQAVLLGRRLQRDGVYHPAPGWGARALRLAAAGTAMVVSLLALAPAGSSWSAWPFWQRATWLAGLIVLGAGVYFATLAVLRTRLAEFREPPAAPGPRSEQPGQRRDDSGAGTPPD